MATGMGTEPPPPATPPLREKPLFGQLPGALSKRGAVSQAPGYKSDTAVAPAPPAPPRDPLSATMSKAQQSQEPLSELEKAMDSIIDVFHQYSRREGDRDTLTKKELKLMIDKQLANYLRHVKNKSTIDQIMKDLDVNKDAQISFGEMMLLVTRVTCATHEHLHEQEQHQHHQHHH